MRQLRREGVDLKEVDAVLEKVRTGKINDHNEPWQQVVAEARKALNEASRK